MSPQPGAAPPRVLPPDAARRRAVKAWLHFSYWYTRASARVMAKEFEFYDDLRIEQLPDPEWLVGNYLQQNTLATLFGASEAGKSVLALDWAFSVVTGLPWAGQPCAQGDALYIYAEGAAGLKGRCRAWKMTRGIDPAERLGLQFIPTAVDLLASEDADAIIRKADEIGLAPSLIVVDTLARSLPGGDENSSRDMGLFVANADRLRTEFDATVLVVHHVGWEGGHERGSTALPWSVDTRMLLAGKKGDSLRILSCEKQKDAAHFDSLSLRLVSVGDSVAFEVVGPAEKPKASLSRDDLRALRVLADYPNGLRFSAWQSLYAPEIHPQKFTRMIDKLLENRCISHDPPLYRVTPEGASRVTSKDREDAA